MEFEEPFQVFLRKIESLGPNLLPALKDTKTSIEALIAASSQDRKWEKVVKKELVKSINEIDKNMSSYKYFTTKYGAVEPDLQKVIDRLKQFAEQMKEKKFYCTEAEPNKEDNTNQQESWVATALKDVENEFVTDPDVRYNNLEPILQRLLLSLCVFPYKQVIKKRSIIYLWIGEGLVKPTRGRTVEQVGKPTSSPAAEQVGKPTSSQTAEQVQKPTRSRTAEQVGKGYFKMLLLSGLVLPIKKKHDKTARGCMLRQNVWQMLKSRAEDNGLFRHYSEEDLTKRGNVECPLACFCATQREEQQVVTSLEQKTNEVLTLFNSSAQYLYCKLSKFTRLKSIKVLQLGKWQSLAPNDIEIEDEKFLDSLQVMEKLTYLGLEGISGITSLKYLKHLHSLRILNLRACHNLKELPSAITSLTNLTHLDVSECTLIDRMPKGLHHLSELQVLKGFIICGHQFTDSCRLQELVGLKKLRKLSINIARHVAANAHLEELNNFTSLRSLTITWGQGPEEPERLTWSSNSIEKLDIRRVPHPRTLSDLNPSQFPNLKKLYISGGKVTEINLGSHIEEWKVETLRLKFLSNLEWGEWSQLVETFPHLAFVEIRECLKLNKKFHLHLSEDGVWEKDKKERSS